MIDVSSTCRQPSCFSQQMKLNILETRWVIHSLNGLPRDSLILCPVDSTFLPHTHTHTHSHPSLLFPDSLLSHSHEHTHIRLLFYFTSYVFNMFRTLIYPSSGACDYSVELLHWSYCSWFDVCWSFGVVELEWYPYCRMKHNL